MNTRDSHDDVEFLRTVAVARITMPTSIVRLSAGRDRVSEMTQAMCFLAGANSIFTGDKLLIAPNAGDDKDAAIIVRLGLRATKISHDACGKKNKRARAVRATEGGRA